MKKTVTKLICKFGAQLCAVAMVIAPLVSDICRNKYYQPEEPEGLAAFANKHRVEGLKVESDSSNNETRHIFHVVYNKKNRL